MKNENKLARGTKKSGQEATLKSYTEKN